MIDLTKDEIGEVMAITLATVMRNRNLLKAEEPGAAADSINRQLRILLGALAKLNNELSKMQYTPPKGPQ